MSRALVGRLKKKYILIDKIVIANGVVLNFDVYSDGKHGRKELVCQKDSWLSKDDVDSLVANRNLYIFEKEKREYEAFKEEFLNSKLIPKGMETLYGEVAKSVSKFFENPEAKENVEEARKIVHNMSDTILEDGFTVSSFIGILSYDYQIQTHSLNVSVYAMSLGKHMGMKEEEIKDLGVSALLHDIGKSKIDSRILNKAGMLSDVEFKEVKKHPLLGWEIARKIGINKSNILSGIRNHHERMDGTGYPDKFGKKTIPKFARVIAVCDCFDALTTRKNYKDPMGTFNALLLMKKDMIEHLDGEVINHFIQIFREESELK